MWTTVECGRGRLAVAVLCRDDTTGLELLFPHGRSAHANRPTTDTTIFSVDSGTFLYFLRPIPILSASETKTPVD